MVVFISWQEDNFLIYGIIGPRYTMILFLDIADIYLVF